MEQELICNIKTCRNKLKDYAWVTSCSHIFCDEDGYEKFGRSLTCPICETSLTDKLDFIHLKLNPSEETKKLLLCGLRPDVILDICSRAVSFWAYQIHQEITYQEFLANKTKETYKQLETTHDDENGKVQVEIACLEQQLEVIRNEIAAQKKNVTELKEKLMDKQKENQKLLATRESFRRKLTLSSQFEKTDFHDSMMQPLQISTNKPSFPGFSGDDFTVVGDKGPSKGSKKELRFNITKPKAKKI